MSKFIFNDVSSTAALKLEVTADDLLSMMKQVVVETTNSVFAKFDEERSPELIPRKDAMKMLNVKTPLTMQRWEEKGYLNPHKISSRIFYRKDELDTAIEKFSRTDED